MNTSRLLNRFRISAAMRPYVLRVRLRGWDFDFGSNPETAAAFTKRIGEMRRLLVERRISVVAADRAILKTMEAAVDYQLAGLRYRSLKAMEEQSHATLDLLIETLRQLRDAIAQLPPNSKGELNKQVSTVLHQPAFDTEVFIDLIETIAEALPEFSPRRHARDALAIIHPEPSEGRRSAIIDLWETMPATTRVKVEGVLLQYAKRSISLVPWLGRIADLLDRERPTRKRGAPRSTMRVFARRIAAIWRGLGLEPGHAYDFHFRRAGDDIDRGRRVESRFQRYCDAALAAVGNNAKVSARQVYLTKKSKSV